MPNFTFIQSTPGPASPHDPLNQTFPGDTVQGNCIVAVLLAILGGAASTPGFSTDITDDQGNKYYAIQGASPFGGVQLYAAVDIKGGPCTVSASVGLGVVAIEYHSAANPYYICPGSAISFSKPPSITNDNVGFHSAVGPPAFTSPGECLVIWGGDVSGTDGPWTAATGTVRYQGLCPGDFGGFQTAAGDDDVANIAVSYGNDIQCDPGSGNEQNGFRSCIIFNLTNPGCTNGLIGGNAVQVSCNNPPAGVVGTAYTHTFTALLGTPPYTFSISAGALPTGLSLNAATGVASGTPTGAGTFNFTVMVTDSAAATASVPCSIVITAAAGTGGGGGTGGGAGSGGRGHSYTCAPCVSPMLATVAGGKTCRVKAECRIRVKKGSRIS